jgi:Flp pilus assembly protein TadG
MVDVMLLARFFKDRHAGVTPLIALVAVPLMGAVGAAVDYSHAATARSAMQNAVDSTSLAMSKDAAKISQAQLTTNADGYFRALFTRTDVQEVSVSSVFSSANGSQVVTTASGTVKPYFVNLLGWSSIPISATATTEWGNKRLRVALALDNTGSMDAAGKMPALKTAAKNLITSLKDASVTDGDVYISIIPFNKDVNVGTTNVDATWLGWSEWDDDNGTCSDTRYKSGGSCTGNGKIWTPKAHSTWTGCVTDRDQNYDASNTTPSSGSTLFPTEQYSSCPTQMMGMSYDWAALKTKVDAMAPLGGTNQPIGLVWAWQSLTEGAPLNAPPLDSKYKYEKIVILMSDGLNTQDRWYGNGSSVSTSVDNRMDKVCVNAKAAGITIYSIQVNTGGDATSTVMRNCASDSKKFFMLTTADQMISTFDQIGTQLSQLHLSK